jgi:hypothetical protein
MQTLVEAGAQFLGAPNEESFTPLALAVVISKDSQEHANLQHLQHIVGLHKKETWRFANVRCHEIDRKLVHKLTELVIEVCMVVHVWDGCIEGVYRAPHSHVRRSTA